MLSKTDVGCSREAGPTPTMIADFRLATFLRSLRFYLVIFSFFASFLVLFNVHYYVFRVSRTALHRVASQPCDVVIVPKTSTLDELQISVSHPAVDLVIKYQNAPWSVVSLDHNGTSISIASIEMLNNLPLLFLSSRGPATFNSTISSLSPVMLPLSILSMLNQADRLGFRLLLHEDIVVIHVASIIPDTLKSAPIVINGLNPEYAVAEHTLSGTQFPAVFRFSDYLNSPPCSVYWIYGLCACASCQHEDSLICRDFLCDQWALVINCTVIPKQMTLSFTVEARISSSKVFVGGVIQHDLQCTLPFFSGAVVVCQAQHAVHSSSLPLFGCGAAAPQPSISMIMQPIDTVDLPLLRAISDHILIPGDSVIDLTAGLGATARYLSFMNPTSEVFAISAVSNTWIFASSSDIHESVAISDIQELPAADWIVLLYPDIVPGSISSDDSILIYIDLAKRAARKGIIFSFVSSAPNCFNETNTSQQFLHGDEFQPDAKATLVLRNCSSNRRFMESIVVYRRLSGTSSCAELVATRSSVSLHDCTTSTNAINQCLWSSSVYAIGWDILTGQVQFTFAHVNLEGMERRWSVSTTVSGYGEIKLDCNVFWGEHAATCSTLHVNPSLLSDFQGVYIRYRHVIPSTSSMGTKAYFSSIMCYAHLFPSWAAYHLSLDSDTSLVVWDQWCDNPSRRTMTFASPIISTGRVLYDEWPVYSAKEPQSQTMALSFFAWIHGRNFQWLAILDQDAYMTSLPKPDSLNNLLSSKSVCSTSSFIFHMVNFGGNGFLSPKYPLVSFMKRSYPLANDHNDMSTGAVRIGVFSMSRGNAVVRGMSWIHTASVAFGNHKDVEPVVVNGNFQTPIISHVIVPTEAACVSRNFADPHYCSAMNSRIRLNFFPSPL